MEALKTQPAKHGTKSLDQNKTLFVERRSDGTFSVNFNGKWATSDFNTLIRILRREFVKRRQQLLLGGMKDGVHRNNRKD